MGDDIFSRIIQSRPSEQDVQDAAWAGNVAANAAADIRIPNTSARIVIASIPD